MMPRSLLVNLLLSLGLAWLVLKSASLQACSSCGSGGADPLILNPSEQRKVYFGLGRQADFRDIDLRGRERKSYGPRSKIIAEAAYSHRLTPSLFASAVASYGRNERDGRTASGWSDSSLNLRYTVLQPSMLEGYYPQLQLILSHRFALGRSMQDAKQDNYLDVLGAGFDETTLGFDAWWGMLPVVGGVSFLYGIPQPHASAEGKIEMGAVQKSIVSVGFMPWSELKILGGVIFERRSGTKLDAREQADSDRQTNDAFLTAETLFPEGDNLRFIVSRRAALGELKNTSRAWGLSLAWMRSL